MMTTDKWTYVSTDELCRILVEDASSCAPNTVLVSLGELLHPENLEKLPKAEGLKILTAARKIIVAVDENLSKVISMIEHGAQFAHSQSDDGKNNKDN